MDVQGIIHQTDKSASVSIASTGDKFTLTAVRPINILRWGFVADTVNITTNGVATLDFRPTAGSNTGRTDGTALQGRLITLGAITQGKGVWEDLTTPLKVDPGEEAVVEMTTAAGAGTAVIFIEYAEMPFVGGGSATGGSKIDSNRIFNMTKKVA